MIVGGGYKNKRLVNRPKVALKRFFIRRRFKFFRFYRIEPIAFMLE